MIGLVADRRDDRGAGLRHSAAQGLVGERQEVLHRATAAGDHDDRHRRIGVELGERGEDASVLAGGHSLLPLMKLRFAAPELLIDIGRLEELQYVRLDGDEIAAGTDPLFADN